MILLLVGPPGSGKGTHSLFLSQKLKLLHVSVGDMLRKIVESGSEEGKLVKQIISEGKLVSDDLVNKIVEQCLSSNEYKNGCILDGYPRNLKQADFLNTIVKKVVVIYCSVDDQVIVKRIIGRFSCLNCGQIYNQYYALPKEAEKCDICGSDKFSYRTDDNEETIIKRLTEYKENTLPIIEYYAKLPNFYTIHTENSIIEIQSELTRILSSLGY